MKIGIVIPVLNPDIKMIAEIKSKSSASSKHEVLVAILDSSHNYCADIEKIGDFFSKNSAA